MMAPGAAFDDALHHERYLVSSDRIDHSHAVGLNLGRRIRLKEPIAAIDAIALVMAIDGPAPPILNAIHQCRLNPFPAIREHGVACHHVVKRRLLGSERIRQVVRHFVVNPEVFGVECDVFHADILCQPYCHEISRIFDAGPKRHRTVKGVVGVGWTPNPFYSFDFDGRIDKNRRGGIAGIQGGRVNERLEGGARLARCLSRSIEDGTLVREAALHG